MILNELRLIDVFAMLAPEPTKDDIRVEMERDRLANPHNDSYKPRRRSEREVVAQLKYRYAQAMNDERLKVK